MQIHRLVAASACAGLLATIPAAARVHDQQVLRAGAHLVQVDAYPLRDGAPIAGLTAADFELLEDGRLQQLDSVRFLDFPTWTPDQQRRDPSSQRESFALASDPNNRLFVVYLNRVPWQLGNLIEPALFEFLDRSMGARDYVSVMTAMQSPGDITFGQLTTAFKSETRRFLNVVDWADPAYLSPEELELYTCFPGDLGLSLISRKRSDDVYRDLEGLVTLLGSIRETKSTLIFVSQTMLDPADVRQLTTTSPTQPRVLSPGQIMPPPAGRGSFPPPGRMIENSRCENLRRSALEPWSSDRFKRLLADARTANVALTPINPAGLVAGVPAVTRAAEHVNDLMRSMASETGGITVVNLNSMRDGFRRVADSLMSHYLLGYYSTNRNADGRVRRITVKLKSNGETIRARREYRAPIAAELTPAPSPPAVGPGTADTAKGVLQALSALERDDRGDPDKSAGRPIDPLMPRLSHAASPPAAPWQPVTRRQFSRTERLRLEWTVPAVAAGGASVQVRVLSRDGRPLAVSIEPSTDATSGIVTAVIRLASFAPGLYVIEATLPDGTVQHVAFRIG